MEFNHENQHPFLGEINHRVTIIDLIKKFIFKNFGVEVNSIRIGHLFFGKKAFLHLDRDTKIIYSDFPKYYIRDLNLPINEGITILIDETGFFYDIGIVEISKNEIGFFIENIIININIKKEEVIDYNFLNYNNYNLFLYKLNNYGTLDILGPDNLEYVKKYASKEIIKLFIFNLEKFR